MSKHEAQLSVCRGAAVGVQSLQSRYMIRKTRMHWVKENTWLTKHVTHVKQKSILSCGHSLFLYVVLVSCFLFFLFYQRRCIVSFEFLET